MVQRGWLPFPGLPARPASGKSSRVSFSGEDATLFLHLQQCVFRYLRIWLNISPSKDEGRSTNRKYGLVSYRLSNDHMIAYMKDGLLRCYFQLQFSCIAARHGLM